MKEFKLVVTGLIKDVQTKEEKLVKMEKEAHQLKIQIDSMKAENEQHHKIKCEKCVSAATQKTDIRMGEKSKNRKCRSDVRNDV